MKRATLIVICFLISESIASQTKIYGKVIADNNIPLVGASVYYNNTSIGTTTDDEGKFELPFNESYKELIASYVGFKTASVILSKDDLYKSITFKLSSENNMLNEVVLNNSKKYSDKERAYFLRRFKQNFIGRGEFSKYCVIENSDVLSFDFNEKIKAFEAFVSEPLILINKKMGYKIFYDLVHFEIVDNRVYYLGYSRFQELKGSKRKKRKWQNARDIAYRGSKVHFLRSIYNENLYDQGFEVDLMKRIPNPNRPSDEEILAARRYLKESGKRSFSITVGNMNRNKPITKLDSVHDILRRSRLKKTQDVTLKSLTLLTDFTEKINTTYHLNFANYLKIRYKNEKEEYSYRPGDLRLDYQETMVTLTKSPLVILKEGETESPTDLFAEGYWAFEKIAYQLPLDFTP